MMYSSKAKEKEKKKNVAITRKDETKQKGCSYHRQRSRNGKRMQESQEKMKEKSKQRSQAKIKEKKKYVGFTRIDERKGKRCWDQKKT